MDIATVRAALAHDSRFDPLLQYLTEKLEPDAPAADPAPAEIVDSSAVQPEGLIERAEDKVVTFAGTIERAIGGVFGADEPGAA